MIVSITYVLIEILLLYFVLQVKHSNKQISFFAWFPVGIVFIMSFHACWAGVISLCNMNISLLSIGCGDLLLFLFCCLGIHCYGNQEYYYNKADFFVLLLVSVAVILFGIMLFGTKLEIHFWSVDASAHCRMALNIAENHVINNNLFFSALNNGIAMMVLKPFIGLRYCYKVYIVMEMFDLWLATIMFFGLLLLIKPEGNKLVAIVLTFCYAVGYPMYAIIFGFSYFGASITLIAACIFLMEANAVARIRKIIFIVVLNILLFALFVCYTYFVPIVCATVFVYLIYITRTDDVGARLRKIISEECKVFLFPVILGLIYSASNLSELGSGGGITNEGGCYFDLYSNFVLLSFFCVYGLIVLRGNIKLLSIRVMLLFSLAFFFVLFMMFSFGRASTYYLSKIYNLFWLEYFLLSYHAIITLWNKPAVIKKGILTGVTLACLSSILENSSIKSENYVTPKSIIKTLLPEIYSFNLLGLYQEYVSDELMNSFWIIKDKYGVTSDSVITIGDEVKCGWFRTVFSEAITISYDIKKLDDMMDMNTKYLYCIDSGIAKVNSEMLEQMGTVIYADEYAKLIELY